MAYRGCEYIMQIIHNSRDLLFRSPFGAVECETDIKLKINIGKKEQVKSVKVQLTDGTGKVQKIDMITISEVEDFDIYEANIELTEYVGLYWYHFIIDTENGTFYYGNNCSMSGGEGEVFYDDPPLSYQITVYKKENTTVDWIKDGIIYQIFPDRFYNGNEDGTVLKPHRDMILRSNWRETPKYIKSESGRIDFFDYFGGNILGVIKKLPYLKELGITIIYLNPIFEAESNHKYDTGDYKKIDAMFGDEELFKELCDKARKQGMRIILDGVFSHTGSDSIYFNREGRYDSLGAYQSKDSEYFDWYKFDHYPDKYSSWWGVDTLPEVEELNRGYLDYIVYDEDSVVNKWSKAGISGWRLDVADELPGEFIKKFKKRLKEVDEDSVLIGEVWEDASNKKSYGQRRTYLLGEELDSTMNYPFRATFLDFFLNVIDSRQAGLEVMQIKENYPIHHFYSLMNMLGTHDSQRILTVLGEAPDGKKISQQDKEKFKLDEDKLKLAVDRLKLLTVIQMTFPGVPSIYYGDEAGLEGYEDPINRRTYPWGDVNTELLEWFKKVTSLRTKYDVLKTGSLEILELDGDVFGFIREITNSKDVFDRERQDNLSVVLVNRSDRDIEIKLDLKEKNIEKLYDVITDKWIDLGEESVVKIDGFKTLVLLKTP